MHLISSVSLWRQVCCTKLCSAEVINHFQQPWSLQVINTWLHQIHRKKVSKWIRDWNNCVTAFYQSISNAISWWEEKSVCKNRKGVYFQKDFFLPPGTWHSKVMLSPSLNGPMPTWPSTCRPRSSMISGFWGGTEKKRDRNQSCLTAFHNAIGPLPGYRLPILLLKRIAY